MTWTYTSPFSGESAQLNIPPLCENEHDDEEDARCNFNWVDVYYGRDSRTNCNRDASNGPAEPYFVLDDSYEVEPEIEHILSTSEDEEEVLEVKNNYINNSTVNGLRHSHNHGHAGPLEAPLVDMEMDMEIEPLPFAPLEINSNEEAALPLPVHAHIVPVSIEDHLLSDSEFTQTLEVEFEEPSVLKSDTEIEIETTRLDPDLPDAVRVGIGIKEASAALKALFSESDSSGSSCSDSEPLAEKIPSSVLQQVESESESESESDSDSDSSGSGDMSDTSSAHSSVCLGSHSGFSDYQAELVPVAYSSSDSDSEH
jgi:hypothetical protein